MAAQAGRHLACAQRGGPFSQVSQGQRNPWRDPRGAIVRSVETPSGLMGDCSLLVKPTRNVAALSRNFLSPY